MICTSVSTPAGIKACFEKVGQSMHVSVIVQIIDAGLLSRRSDLSRSAGILQHSDHLVGEIAFITWLRQAGVDVVGKKLRKVSNAAGNHRSSGSQILAQFVR